MKIKKGTLLKVSHRRSGKWTGIAREDFDTEDPNCEFYPINLAQENSVYGMVTEWEQGEQMPCRNSLCTLEVL